MSRMFSWGISFACAAAVLVAGCATAPRPNRNGVPDWEAEPGVAEVKTIPPDPVPPVAVATLTNTVSVPASPPVVELKETWVSLARWCKNRNLPPPRPVVSAPQPSFILNATNGVFGFRVGSLIAVWQGVEVRLGFAPQLIDGQPFLHSLDIQKNLQPLLGDPLPLPGTNHVIVLDPGHGGENAGTQSVLGRHYEKDYTLDWALRLAPLLAANGWTVFLTRTNDSDLALSNRVAFAEQHRAALFLSLHFNSSAPDEVQSGLETYCLTPVGMPSTVTRGFRDEIVAGYPNNAFDAQNLGLALRVHAALLQVNGRRDRGVRRARFPGVLRGNQRPAILVEGGYLSNPAEARLIATRAYRQKLAEATASALGPAAPVAATPAAVVPPVTKKKQTPPGPVSSNLLPVEQP